MRILNSKKAKNLLILIVISAFVLTAWSWIIPFDGAPDEIHHYEVVQYIARHFRWPVFGPQGDLYIRSAPGTRDGMVFGFYALQSTFPYLIPAIILRLFSFDSDENYHIARIGSVIYGVIAIIALFLAVLTLFPRSPLLQRIIVSLPLVVPQSAYIFSYINQDSFGIMANNLLFAALVKFKFRKKMNLWAWFAIGGAWMLTAMARQHVAILGTLMVFVFFIYSQHRNDFRKWIQLIGTSIMPLFVIFCWLLRNYLLYSDPFLQKTARSAWDHWLELVAPHLLRPSFAAQGYSLSTFVFSTPWASETFKSFWAKFGYMSLEPWQYVYWIYALISVVFIAGFFLYLAKSRDFFLVSFGILFLVLLGLHGYKNYTGDFQPQGRYLMIGQSLIFSILGIGMRFFVSNFKNRPKKIVIICVFVALSIINLSIMWLIIPKIPGVSPVGE